MGEHYKHCTVCGELLPYTRFYKDKNKRDGYCCECKTCSWRRSTAWQKANPEKLYTKQKRWNAKNLDKLRAKNMRHYHKVRKHRFKTEPLMRLIRSQRSRISNFIKKGLNKPSQTLQLIGCTKQELKIFLEGKFTAGMTWENYGTWHVDHIKPLALFDLSDPEQVKVAFHFSNLQPMWAKDNLSKGAKFETHV